MSDCNSSPGRPKALGETVYFAIAEVAERLDVTSRTVHRWIASGDLVVHRIGRVVRISDQDLRTFLKRHRLRGKHDVSIA